MIASMKFKVEEKVFMQHVFTEHLSLLHGMGQTLELTNHTLLTALLCVCRWERSKNEGRSGSSSWLCLASSVPLASDLICQRTPVSLSIKED